ARIPADLRIAKILLFGAIFKCLSPVLTIAAIMSAKSPFVSPMERREEARTAREKFLTDRSDWMTDTKAYEMWGEAIGQGGRRAGMEFCEENFLSFQTLQSISDLRRQYRDILVELGYVPEGYKAGADGGGAGVADMDLHSKDGRIVKAVIVAGLYPQVARISLPEKRFEETAHGTVEVECKPEEIRYYTPSDGRVFLHPSSINFTSTNYQKDPFLMYLMKVETSTVFLRDSTSVGVWPVLMFGGK
ncbi:ATPdependent RNA helicase, partial [Rhizophlyctis rosea]